MWRYNMINTFANRSLTQTHTNVNPSVIGYINNEDYIENPHVLDLGNSQNEQTTIIPQEFRDDKLIYLKSRKYVIKHFDILDPIIHYKSTNSLDLHIDTVKEIGKTIVTITSEISRLNTLTKDIKTAIDDIVNIDFDWEGRGLEMPNDITISTSKKIMEHLITQVFKKKHIDNWIEPFVYSEEDGYICIGWYHKNKTLYLNIKDKVIKYRKLFNSDNDNSRKSKQGILHNHNCFSIWRWMFIDE